MAAKGPLVLTSDAGFTCEHCGRKVPSGGKFYLGHAAGKLVHACSVDCFVSQVATLNCGRHVPDFVKTKKVVSEKD